MKSKKKALIIAALLVACMGVLTLCLILGSDSTPMFIPEPVVAETPSAWEEAHSAGDSGNHAKEEPAAPENEYPKEAQDAQGNVAVEFTPPAEDLKPEAPAPPKAAADNTDPAAPPAYAPEEVAPPAENRPTASDTPAPGSSNGTGAVYDPVFGWVVPGQVVQTPIDSQGNPDKMVGEMGE